MKRVTQEKSSFFSLFRPIKANKLKGTDVQCPGKQVELNNENNPELETRETPGSIKVQPEEVTESEATELPIELLEQSFEKVKPHANEFASSFYDNLFASHPELKHLFSKTDMKGQEKKLLNSLVLLVENLRNPEVLAPVLNALGARHVSYGAIPKYYGSVQQALLMTFEQYLQEDWTEEVKDAWTKALRAITAQMLKGSGAAASPTVVQKTTTAVLETPVFFLESGEPQ